MRVYLKFLLSTLLTALIMFEVVVIGIIKYPGGVFHDSYQSMIQDKYRILKETNEPKIIIVAGSSSAFGLNQKMLEDASGYKVANLGLHAGFGHLFYSELAKANINSGDIVLLGYEYGWQDGITLRNQGVINRDLIMSAIDDNLEMYTRIPIREWTYFIGYIFKYAEIKNNYAGPSEKIYSREAFDSETGQMTMARDYVMEYSEEVYGTEDISNVEIAEEAKEYLIQYKEYIENQGASVYFIAPPLAIEGVACDYAEFDKLKQLEEEEIGIPYISNPTDYLFPSNLMANTLYHCNSAGEKVRTELLINDLKRAHIIQ